MTECGKKKYQSWQHATADAKSLRRHKAAREAPYYCRACQSYHVGAVTMKKPVKKYDRTKSPNDGEGAE